jgi:uncharacterized OsmC-like protein
MYSASIENNGDSKYYAATKDCNFVIDTEGQGANPVDTVLAGLCGCLGHWTRDYIHGEQIDAKGFTIRAEAELTGDRKRLSKIDVYINMKGVELGSQHKEELRRHVQNCLVHNTLEAGCTITITLPD